MDNESASFTINDVIMNGVDDPSSFLHGAIIQHVLRYGTSKDINDLKSAEFLLQKLIGLTTDSKPTLGKKGK